MALRKQIHPPPLAVIAILILGAYWAGARWGQRQPVDVGAGASGGADDKSLKNASYSERDAALSSDEALKYGSTGRRRRRWRTC